MHFLNLYPNFISMLLSEESVVLGFFGDILFCGVFSFVGILEDISWKKEAEESLRRSEERYVLAVRGSNDGLWDWDMVTNQVFYSQRYKHMLGMGANDVSDTLGVFETRLHPIHHGRSFPASVSQFVT